MFRRETGKRIDPKSTTSTSRPQLSLPQFRIPNPRPMHLALFDFDHTITTCDSYGRFLRKVATPAQVVAAR